MKPTVGRLVLCAGVFVLWLGYLGYLVATRPVTSENWPLVLSRPQIQASSLDVVADLPELAKGEVEVTVIEVLFPAESEVKPGDKIRVTNLAECRPLPRHAGSVPPWDWSGSGRYLLPLRRAAAVPNQPERYEVMPIPSSPGFSLQGVVRIYPATAEALAQYKGIEK